MAQRQFLRIRRRSRQFLFRLWLGLLLIIVVGWLSAPLGLAQTPAATPDEPPAENPQLLDGLESIAPPGVQALLANDLSDLATAAVQLDGRTLFLVAAPATGPTRDQPSLSAQQRAHEIERRLDSITAQGIDPESLRVSQEFDPQSNQPIVEVNRDFLVTVTFLDAQLRGYSNTSIRAREIVDAVENALLRYHRERQPDYLRRQGKLAGGLGLAMLVVCLGIRYLQFRLRRYRQCQTEPEAESAAVNGQGASPEPTTALRRHCRERERRGLLDLAQALLYIGQLANGGLGAYVLFGMFPHTRWLQGVLLGLLKLPLTIGILGLVTYWLIRLGAVWVDRLFIVLQEGAGLAPTRSQRLELRFSTFSQVVKGVLWVLTCLIALIIGLGILGVRIGPILTGAGLVGLAFSLASQSLIQDFINGFLILLEDQYGVGDVIMVEHTWGFVEAMNLRITQLRNEEGRLITIPNSKIGIVQNLSKEWSRVDLMIPVALTADLNAALITVEQVANTLCQDAIWGHLILEPPLLLGVDQLDHVGATIRIWIKTQPLKQWDVAREYRRRLKLAFEEAGIDIGVPQQIIHVNGQAGAASQHHDPLLSRPVGTSF